VAQVVIGALHLPFFFAANLVLNALASGLFAGAFMAVAQRGARGQTPSLSDAFRPFRERQGDYLLVGLAMSSGVVLLGVGILVTSTLFMFAPLLVVQGLSYKEALGASKDLVLARLADVIVLCAVVAVMNLAGFVVCGAGLLVSVPLSALAVARAHALLTGSAQAQATTPSLPGAPT
jgi:hypothetical protein